MSLASGYVDESPQTSAWKHTLGYFHLSSLTGRENVTGGISTTIFLQNMIYFDRQVSQKSF